MTLPRPVWLYHFTHLQHLPSILADGLVCDAHAAGRLVVEVGNRQIKAGRRKRKVPRGPGGVVADYVPFYFAPRSPMLYAIHKGNVPSYTGGEAGLIYLCTTLERLEQIGLSWVATDRNAALDLAAYADRLPELRELVDWPLMDATMWHNTDEDPERRERRMAEVLVHQRVPWEAIEFVGARTVEDLTEIRRTLATLKRCAPRADVRPHWYFCRP